MNAETKNTSLAIPEPATLAVILKSGDGLEGMLSKLEIAARDEAKGYDVGTKKGRDARKSLAYKVSQSKAELDRQGLALTEQARKEIDAVNAGRKAAKDRLDALRDEVKQPALDWEAKEEARVQGLRDRLAVLDAGRADVYCPSSQIAAVIAEIEAVEIGDDWQEFQTEAEIAKASALDALKSNLAVAEKREADERELEELRAMRAAKEEEDRKRKEAEEAAAALKARADKARAYIREIGEGTIGGAPQAFGILIYELESKLPPLVDELGEYAADVHDLRKSTLASVTASMEKQAAEDEAAAEAKRKADAEAAEAEAKARAERQREEDEKRHAEEVAAAAQAERDRIEAEKKAEAAAAEARAADKAHRDKIRTDIIDALSAMRGKATPEAIADALMAGEIPHTEVKI